MNESETERVKTGTRRRRVLRAERRRRLGTRRRRPGGQKGSLLHVARASRRFPPSGHTVHAHVSSPRPLFRHLFSLFFSPFLFVRLVFRFLLFSLLGCSLAFLLPPSSPLFRFPRFHPVASRQPSSSSPPLRAYTLSRPPAPSTLAGRRPCHDVVCTQNGRSEPRTSTQKKQGGGGLNGRIWREDGRTQLGEGKWRRLGRSARRRRRRQ